jgi:hypothetical protein
MVGGEARGLDPGLATGARRDLAQAGRAAAYAAFPHTAMFGSYSRSDGSIVFRHI